MPTYRIKAHYREKGKQRKRTMVHTLVTKPCEKEARLHVLVKHIECGHRVLRIEAKPI